MELLGCRNQYTYSQILISQMEMCQKIKELRIKFCRYFYKNQPIPNTLYFAAIELNFRLKYARTNP